MNLKTIVKNQRIVIASVSTALVLVLLIAGGVGYAWAHQSVFYPGVSVGDVELGGLGMDEGRALLHEKVDNLLDEGMRVQVLDQEETISLRTIAPDDPDLARELITIDVDSLVDEAFAVGHSGSVFVQAGDLITTLLGGVQLTAPVIIEEGAVQEALVEQFADLYDPAINPTFDITEDEAGEGGWLIEVVPGHTGTTFSLDGALDQMTDALEMLNLDTITLSVDTQEPDVLDHEAEELIPDALLALENGPYDLAYEESRFETFHYTLDTSALAGALTTVVDDGAPSLGFNESLEPFFTAIAEDINIEPSNARFDISGTRVREFAPSKQGRAVDLELTMARLRTEIMGELDCHDDCEEQEFVEIAVKTTEPEITTESVNDLGITEVLGVGISDFSGSPSNRIKNIRHGMSKLNGVLIAPDEEFSLINTLKPFTIADGYLPELVIKGDEIKPEIGGGLCQIGSTTFRAVMNSGLAITQRRNHSLVVNYYNDPSNGNPGTDATLYDPAPDFRFINDTGNHILLRTEMNTSTGELKFTFWGTSDGRKGYYSAPVVHNWIGAGPTRTTYTTDLAPGERKCQGAHPGANTSFTYTVEQSDGEVDETLYESHYRALPTICLVGVGEDELDEDGNYIPPEERVSEETEDTESSESTDSTETTEESSEVTTEDDAPPVIAPDETPDDA